MSNRTLPLKRDFDATRLNAVVNNAEVRPWVLAEGTEALDLTSVVANSHNVALMCDSGGMLFVALTPGVYEVHTQFLASARGAFALAFAREAVRWMFTRSDCVELWTKVPQNNKPALGLTQAMGGRYEFTRPAGFNSQDVKHFSMSYLRWAQSDSSCRQLGQWFHETLEAKFAVANISEPLHPDDPSHDSAVGATIATIRANQLDKALALYNRWAAVAGYAPINLLCRWPWVLDIRTALVVLNTDASDFEVLKRGA